MAPVAMVVPPLPPSEMIPSSLPSRSRRRVSVVSPVIIYLLASLRSSVCCMVEKGTEAASATCSCV